MYIYVYIYEKDMYIYVYIYMYNCIYIYIIHVLIMIVSLFPIVAAGTQIYPTQCGTEEVLRQRQSTYGVLPLRVAEGNKHIGLLKKTGTPGSRVFQISSGLVVWDLGYPSDLHKPHLLADIIESSNNYYVHMLHFVIDSILESGITLILKRVNQMQHVLQQNNMH